MQSITINGKPIAAAVAESIIVPEMELTIRRLKAENKRLERENALLKRRVDEARWDVVNAYTPRRTPKTAFQLAHPIMAFFVEPIED